MKKQHLIALLISVFMAFILAGCLSSELSNSTTNKENNIPSFISEEISEPSASTTPQESELEITDSEPLEPSESPEVTTPTYTFTDFTQTMYANSSVNVRSLPNSSSKKLGNLSMAQEVTVTGQCNETSWYRINYNGSDAYVSNNYLVDERPVEKPVEKPAPDANTSLPQDNSQSSGPSVTVPDKEETIGELVWVPTNGGTKYHTKASCSGMKDPLQVSIDTAIANGFEPCKRCH